MGYPADVPVLTDGVVTLRAYTMDDLDGCVEQCTDPESVAWTTVPVPYTREDGTTWITTTVPEFWQRRTDLAFAVEAAHPDGVRRFAGGVGLRPKGEGIAELAFGLHPAVRGRGVCHRAVGLLLDWGFQQPDIDVVMWLCYVGNWASRRVAWASGFSMDATLEKFLPHRGERRDAWFGTLRATDARAPRSTWFVPPVLETEHLRLRPFVDADADRLSEMVTDERALHFGGRIKRPRPRDGAAALLRVREQNASGEVINWCVADRHTDRLLGQIQIFDMNGLDDTEIKPGYVTHPDARGRGVLTEALIAVTEWVFRPVTDGGFGRRRITISTAASNIASRYVAERAGYTHVATQPSAFTVGAADFDDEVIYQLVNEKWEPPAEAG